MAKFCKFCGTPLEEGQVCACQSAPAPAEAPAPEKQDAKAYATGFWAMFKSFIKKPVTTGKAFVNSCDFKYALIIMGIQAILVGLLVMSLVGKYNTALKNVISMTGSYSDMMEAQVMGVMFSLPTVFIVSAIATFAVACIIPAVIMLFIKMFKGNTNYKYMLCVSALNSLVLIPFILVAILVSVITPLNINFNNMESAKSIMNPIIYPVAIATIGLALGNFVMISAIPGGSDVDKDALPYVMFLTGIIMAVVTYFVFKITVPMCLPPAIESGLNSLESAGNMIDSLF